MALKSIAYVGVPKKDASKRYIKVNKGVTLKVILEDGTEITVPAGSYLNMVPPKKKKDQSEESYQELLSWKRFDILVSTGD